MVAELEHLDDNVSLYGKNVSRTHYVLRSLNPEKFVVNVLFKDYFKLCFYLPEQCLQKSYNEDFNSTELKPFQFLRLKIRSVCNDYKNWSLII